MNFSINPERLAGGPQQIELAVGTPLVIGRQNQNRKRIDGTSYVEIINKDHFLSREHVRLLLGRISSESTALILEIRSLGLRPTVVLDDLPNHRPLVLTANQTERSRDIRLTMLMCLRPYTYLYVKFPGNEQAFFDGRTYRGKVALEIGLDKTSRWRDAVERTR